MEVFGKSPAVGSANIFYLSAILGCDGPIPCHKCDWKCENENVCGNMYRCKLTGLNHVCDKNCDQRILYDNHNSLCRASGWIFPLSSAEEQAVKESGGSLMRRINPLKAALSAVDVMLSFIILLSRGLMLP